MSHPTNNELLLATSTYTMFDGGIKSILLASNSCKHDFFVFVHFRLENYDYQDIWYCLLDSFGFA